MWGGARQAPSVDLGTFQIRNKSQFPVPLALGQAERAIVKVSERSWECLYLGSKQIYPQKGFATFGI